MIIKTATILTLLTTTALAAPLSEMKQIRCENEAGSYLSIEVETNTIFTQLQELPYLSNEYIQEREPLDIYRWVPEKLHGFGGLASSHNGRLTGLVTFLYNAQDEANLPEQGEMRVHYADLNGITTQEVMSCRLTFGK
ncbi:MAG: hypothetical protein HUU37_02115 [Bdellovibrionales bacterium]|nr:hypothetical protein [Bdellovibrionales bacterium]